MVSREVFVFVCLAYGLAKLSINSRSSGEEANVATEKRVIGDSRQSVSKLYGRHQGDGQLLSLG